jgi:hypothetical protein
MNQQLQELGAAYNENLEGSRKAFSMSDVHHQVLLRVVRELALAVAGVRKLSVDGDVDFSLSDLAPLKLRTDGMLDMRSYYEEYRTVAETAGVKNADVAVVLWSQGYSPEDAVARATVVTENQAEQVAAGVPVVDPDYEDEYFGGNSGQNHHEQVQASAGANG